MHDLQQVLPRLKNTPKPGHPFVKLSNIPAASYHHMLVLDNSSHSKQTLSSITLNSLHKKSLLDLSICILQHTSYKLKLKNLTLTFVLIYVTLPGSLAWDIDCFCCGFVWGFCFCVDDMKLCLIPCLEEMQDHWGTSVSLFWSTFQNMASLFSVCNIM